MRKQSLLLTVDYRGRRQAGRDYFQALEMAAALSACHIDVELLNVNQPLESWLGYRPDATLWCLAHDFAPGTRNARRYPGAFAVRRALDHAKRFYIGNHHAAFLRTSSADKIRARKLLRSVVNVPRACVVRRADGLQRASARVERLLELPVVIKRTRDTGGGIGVWLAKDREQLQHALQTGFEEYGPELLAEEFVTGTELTAWIVDSRRGPKPYGLMEIRKAPDRPMLNHAAKRMARPGNARQLRAGAWPVVVVPPRLNAQVLQRAAKAAVRAHSALGLRHYSRVDMIISGNVPRVLEVNGAPKLLSGGLGLIAESLGKPFGQALLDIVSAASDVQRGSPR
jgi:D-alanine-D-alanine ligase